MFLLRKKVKPKSIQHKLGESAPQPLPESEMERLTAKLRDRTITEAERELLCMSHVRLAIYIAGQYAHQAPNKVDDLVSEAVTAISVAAKEAPEKMTDNNFTGFCAARIHSLVNTFVDKDHLVCVSSRTYRHKKATGQETPQPVKVVSYDNSNHRACQVEKLINASTDRDDVVLKMHTSVRRRSVLQVRVNRIRDIKEMIADSVKTSDEQIVIQLLEERYTVREIADKTGMCKSQVSILRLRVAQRYEQLETE